MTPGAVLLSECAAWVYDLWGQFDAETGEMNQEARSGKTSDAAVMEGVNALEGAYRVN